jgi:hypothetical protein
MRPIVSEGLRIDLEDASLAAVGRDASSLTLSFRSVRLQSPDAHAWEEGSVDVTLHDVLSESALHCTGGGLSTPVDFHTALPLDFVQSYDWDGATLDLQGTLRGEAWFVWTIRVARLEVRVVPPR